MAYATVAELTVEELRALIREVVAETLRDELRDPDAGLDLPDPFREVNDASTPHRGRGNHSER